MPKFKYPTGYDDDFLNAFKKIIDYLNRMGYTHEEMLRVADAILKQAKRINEENISTHERLDRTLGELTQESEVIDARGNDPILGARLNRYDYLIERPKLNNGKLILPSDFPDVPFNIYRKNYYDWAHDATPYNQHDWSSATEIFITNTLISGRDGLSFDKAVRPDEFKSLFESGAYGNQDTFILTFIDNTQDRLMTLPEGVKNIFIRSASPTGKTLWARTKRVGEHTSEWQPHKGIYKLTDHNNHTASDIINLRQSEWVFGMPKYYKRLDTISDVENEPGTYYAAGNEVYCHPHINESVHNLVPTVAQNMFTANTDLELVIFKDTITTNLTNDFSFNDCSVYWFDCGFYRGPGQDGFRIRGDGFKAYILDCTSVYSQKDGFNYSPSSRDNLAVEVNTVSHSNGAFKSSSGNQTTHSNNGSTAHNGMYMLRIGSHYWDCEGPVVADVNDCYSISIGVKVGDILPTTTGSKSAFFLSDESRTGMYPKYVLECEAYGKNIEYGINAPQGNVYYMDFVGNDTINGASQIESWGD